MGDKDKLKKEEKIEEEEGEEENSENGEESSEDGDFDAKVEDEDEEGEEESEEDEDDGEEEYDVKQSADKRKADRQQGEDPALKKKVKKEEGEDDEKDDGIKWKYIEHHGVLFPPYWQRHNIQIKYDGKKVDNLTIYQEEMATYWAQTLDTDYPTRKIYKDNFVAQWKKTWPKDTEYKEFDKFNFRPIKEHLDTIRDARKNRTKEEKLAEKEKQAQKDKYYGYAIIDGDKERIGGYMIEPPTLFKGRGEHPKAGLMKARIMPEQFSINVAENAPVPKCEVPGHAWMEILHRNDSCWLGGYKDDTINKTHKYIQMAATSKFKYLNDMKKYDRARRLKKMVHKIRDDYEKKMNSGNQRDAQLGTAIYLIDFLALRVGNEKGEDEADTVGCCSLRVEHVKAVEDSKIEFDFLGKDSMRYHQIVEVKKQAWHNINTFSKGKKGERDLFDRISTNDVNQYLKDFMNDLTAKVFRTFNASDTLQKELDKSKDLKVHKMTVEQKADFYDNAVKQVAVLCNHQKTVNKNFDIQLDKLKDKIEIYKKYKKELEDHLKKFAKGGKGVKKETKEEVILEKKDDGNHKMFTKKFPESKDKSQQELDKIKEKITKEQQNVDKRESNKDIALGTSKTNYNDPRITVTWCKNVDQPIEKPFPKTLRDKFLWAMSVEPDYQF